MYSTLLAYFQVDHGRIAECRAGVIPCVLFLLFSLICGNVVCSVSAQSLSPSFQHVKLGILSPVTGNLPGYDIGDAISVYMAIADINRFVLANVTNNQTELALAKQQAPLDLSYLDEPFLLSAIMNDTSVSAPISAVDAFLQIYQNNVVGIIGSTDSSLCESVAIMAQLFNTPTVSPECTSPALSDQQVYSTFFRTIPSDDLQANAITSLVRSFGWKNVAILATNDAYGFGVAQSFQNAATIAGINVLSMAVFTFDSNYAEAAQAVQQIQSSRARIILLFMTTPDSTNVYQALSDFGMLTDEYVYIGPDGMLGLANFANATIAEHARGLLVTVPFSGAGLPQYMKFMDNWQNNTVNMFPADVQPYISQWMFQQPPLTISSAQAYDATLMYAVAINRILKREAANGSVREINGQLLVEEFLMPDFNFTGISGFVFFNGADRIADYEVYNLNQQGTEFESLGIIQPSGLVSNDFLQSVVFHSGSNIVPSDLAPTIPQVEKSVSSGAIIFVIVLMVIECVFVVYCVIFTIIHRATPVIKASSPAFLLVIAFGVLLGLSCIPLLFYNSDSLCQVYPLLLGVAVVLVFSALFIKTYRVAVIFNQKQFNLHVQSYRTDRLLLYVAGATLFEVAFNISWMVSSPDKLQSLSNGSANEYFRGCGGGSHYNDWLIASYAYKGVALLWGVYLAVRVRSVFSYFNESKYVISCIFMVAFTCMIVPAAFYTSNSPTIRFLLECLWILVLGAFIPSALWVPKIYTALFDPEATGQCEKQSNSLQATKSRGKGLRLLGNDQLVAPGVRMNDNAAAQLHSIMAQINTALKDKDLFTIQHTLLQAVRISGLVENLFNGQSSSMSRHAVAAVGCNQAAPLPCNSVTANVQAGSKSTCSPIGAAPRMSQTRLASLKAATFNRQLQQADDPSVTEADRTATMEGIVNDNAHRVSITTSLPLNVNLNVINDLESKTDEQRV